MDSIKSAIDNHNLRELEHLLTYRSPFLARALFYAVQRGINNRPSASQDGQNQLAIENNQVVKFILQLGANPNVIIETCPTGRIFAYACLHASVDIVRTMMDHRASLKLSDKHRLIPIQRVFQSGDREKIQLFWDRGLAADSCNRLHLLHHYLTSKSASEGSTVARLLQLGATVNETMEDGTTVLRCALKSGNLQLVKMMVEGGADVNSSNGEGMSELEYTVSEGKTELVKYLLDGGANHPSKEYLLGVAACRGYKSIVELLFTYGVDVSGEPLELAVKYEQYETVETLLRLGARHESHLLLKSIRRGNERLVRILLEAGFDANCRRADHYFYERGELFGFRGASETALAEAVKAKNLEIVRLLLDHGARVNGLHGGRHILLYREAIGDNEMFKLLVETGAAVDVVDVERNDESPLTLAMGRERHELCRFLVRKFALIKSEGSHVSEINWNASREDAILSEFQDKCVSEIELLKSERIDDSSLSYYDIYATKDVCKLASNENIVRVVKSNDFVERFSIYGQMIVDHLDRGITRNKDFELMKKFTNYLSSREHDKLPKLPFTFVTDLFSYLNGEDVATLRNL